MTNRKGGKTLISILIRLCRWGKCFEVLLSLDKPFNESFNGCQRSFANGNVNYINHTLPHKITLSLIMKTFNTNDMEKFVRIHINCNVLVKIYFELAKDVSS